MTYTTFSLYAAFILFTTTIIITNCSSDSYCSPDECNKIYENKGETLERLKQAVSVELRVLSDNLSILHRSIFFPIVDDYTLLEVNNSYNTLNNSQSDLKIEIEVNGYSNQTELPPKIYMSNSSVVGFHVLVVSISAGRVIKLEWDTGCGECQDNCIEGFCTNPVKDCTLPTANCNIKVYLAWIGTDKYGVYCTSAGSLTSRLRQWALNNLYQQAANLLTTLPDHFKGLW